MQQLALTLPPPRARRRDPATSKASSARVREFDDAHYDRIHAALEEPLNIHELAERTGLDAVQIARRLPERPDLFHPTNETRRGPSGRACRLWRRA